MSTTPAGSSGRRRPVCLTGATGYIGGRLAARLLERGHRLRCLVRDASKLKARPWSASPDVEVVECDLDDPEALAQALTGVGSAFYLVHSMMAAGAAYADTDRRLARRFAQVAGSCGLERIIYLGGLGETGDGLSRHLASRREVEAALASGPVPV
ncbi:MAG: NAD(P)H-binding protein, partial [Planctomycetota bacterium]